MLASVAIFVVLVGIAIASYPGGSALDRRAAGHDLLRNFLCDLLAPVALNGAPNPVGAIAAPAAMLVLIAGLGVFWWMLPDAFPAQRRLGRALRAAGALTTVGLVAVPLTPSGAMPVLHAIAVLIACAPAMIATALGALGLARGGRRVDAALGAAVLAVGGIDAALFAHHCAVPGPVVLALPALQRVACGLLLAWVVLVATKLARARADASRLTPS